MATDLVHIETLPEGTDRAEWLERRRRFIGGSDSAAMFNEGYGCTRRLVYDKRGTPIDFPRTQQEIETMQRGTELEELVAFKFQTETGLKIRKSATRVSKEEPRAGVNIDRQIVGVSEKKLGELFPKSYESGVVLGPTGVLECKTANENVFKQIQIKGVPSHYVLQMQHSLAVTGYKWGIFAVLGYGPTLWRLLWFPMLRDEKLCQAIIARVPEVWKMVEFGPFPDALPQPDKRCSKCEWRRTCLGSAFTAAPEDDGVYAEDDSLSEIVADYLSAKAAAAETDEVLEIVKGQLKTRLGDRQHVAIPSLNARIRFKEVIQQRVDTNGLKAKYPEIASECVKPVKSRALYVDVTE